MMALNLSALKGFFLTGIATLLSELKICNELRYFTMEAAHRLLHKKNLIRLSTKLPLLRPKCAAS